MPEAADPETLITWNANGLMPRVASEIDLAALQARVRESSPDVICLQEARVKAFCANPKAKPGDGALRYRARPSDKEMKKGGPLNKALRSAPLDGYKVFWSLADGRYAGTAMFVSKRLGVPVVVYSISHAREKFGLGNSRQEGGGGGGVAGGGGGGGGVGGGSGGEDPGSGAVQKCRNDRIT